jgi:hypothetical protein
MLPLRDRIAPIQISTNRWNCCTQGRYLLCVEPKAVWGAGQLGRARSLWVCTWKRSWARMRNWFHFAKWRGIVAPAGRIEGAEVKIQVFLTSTLDTCDVLASRSGHFASSACSLDRTLGGINYLLLLGLEINLSIHCRFDNKYKIPRFKWLSHHLSCS